MQKLNKNNINILAASFSGVVAIVIGLYFNELSIFIKTGYYFVLMSCLLWLYSLQRLLSYEMFSRGKVIDFLAAHWFALVTPVFVISFAILISPPEIKILSDEANLINTSHIMYKEHQVYMVMVNVVRDFGFSENVVFGVDKRGLFFPFLLSVIHTFIGYDPHNGFIVNIIAGYFLLVVFYFFLLQWFSKFSAILGMMLLAAFPIIIIYMLSSGFEVLNVLFVIINLHLLFLFLIKKDWRYAEALLMSSVLLAHIRYESVLFSLIIISILLFELRHQSSYKFSFLTFVTPFLFLPVLWQRLLTSDYQLPENTTQVFGLDNLLQNFPHWWTFFSGAKDSYGVIGPVFYFSIIGFIWAAYTLITNRSNIAQETKTMTSAVLFSYISVALVIMLYWSGSLVEGFVSRLSLVFIPLIIFFAIFLVEKISNIIKQFKKVPLYLVLILFTLYWPEIGRNTAIRSLEGYQRYHLVMNYIKTNYPDKVITVIDPYTTWFNIHGLGAISYAVANSNADSMLQKLKDNALDELLVLQNVSFETGEVYNGYKMDDMYKLEKLYARGFRDDTFVQISRVLKEYN